MKTYSARNGAILLQTLVMAVILSMISVMVLKWVMARYLLTSRINKSAVANIHASGYIGNDISRNWKFTIPTAADSRTRLPGADSKVYDRTVTSVGSGARIVISIDDGN